MSEDFPNNNSFNTGIENDNRISISTENSTEKRQRAFFSDYRRHSQQLVDALKQWSSQLEFIDYEYSDGELNRSNQKFLEPYVPYMDYMKKHLESNEYGEDFINPNSIQSKRKIVCDEIEKIMVKVFPSPHSQSFNMLIINRIKFKCPKLEATFDADTNSNNFYLPKRIFSILFDVISGKRTLRLSTKIYQDDIYELIFESQLTVARGDDSTIQSLRGVLESLVEDDNLLSHVKRYHELRDKLTTNIDLIELKRHAEKLHTFIYGGKLLGGFQSCKLCIPDVIADVE